MKTLRQNPLLRATIEPETLRVLWRGVDGKRWEAVKKFLAGQEVEITIGRYQKKRSLKQNRYLWGVVNAMVAEAGGFRTAEEAHDALRMHFLLKHGDLPMPTIGSTTELTTIEFNEYCEKVRGLAAEMWGIYIPEPNEVIEG